MTQGDDTLPLWARLADVAALVLVALCMSVLFWGGVRAHVGGVRLSATSVPRLLLLAIALLALRHGFVRRQPLLQRLVSAIRQAGRSPALAAAWPVAVYSRVAVLLVGYFAVLTIGYPSAPPFRIAQNEWWNLPARWDAGWYLSIVRDGYEGDRRSHRERQQTIAFFPAYPALMWAGGVLVGAGQRGSPGEPEDYRAFSEMSNRRFLMAGLAISLIAFCWALTYFYRLAREDLDEERARGALMLLAAYPFAVFFSAPYTEALFLLGVVAAVYHFRRSQWLAAGAWGFLVGLTRPNGFLLSIPLGILALQRLRGGHLARALRLPIWLSVVAPMAAVLLFSVFVYVLTGRPFAWAEAHGAWGRTERSIETFVAGSYKLIAGQGIYQYTVSVPIDLMNALAAAAGLAAVWPVARRFGMAYAAFVAVNLVPPLLAGGVMSIGRLTATLFPVFLYLATAASPRTREGCIAAFATMQGLAAALFFTWRPLV